MDAATSQSMEGLSARSVIINAFCQLVILLYLLDNDTSFVVLLSSAVVSKPPSSPASSIELLPAVVPLACLDHRLALFGPAHAVLHVAHHGAHLPERCPGQDAGSVACPTTGLLPGARSRLRAWPGPHSRLRAWPVPAGDCHRVLEGHEGHERGLQACVPVRQVRGQARGPALAAPCWCTRLHKACCPWGTRLHKAAVAAGLEAAASCRAHGAGPGRSSAPCMPPTARCLPCTRPCRASYNTSNTKKHDEDAMRYLSYALYPLVGGYAVYSLMYKSHKSWCVCVLARAGTSVCY